MAHVSNSFSAVEPHMCVVYIFIDIYIYIYIYIYMYKEAYDGVYFKVSFFSLAAYMLLFKLNTYLLLYTYTYTYTCIKRHMTAYISKSLSSV